MNISIHPHIRQTCILAKKEGSIKNLSYFIQALRKINANHHCEFAMPAQKTNKTQTLSKRDSKGWVKYGLADQTNASLIHHRIDAPLPPVAHYAISHGDEQRA
jgi:hypothetical protein